jgi:hypothetical protein
MPSIQRLFTSLPEPVQAFTKSVNNHLNPHVHSPRLFPVPRLEVTQEGDTKKLPLHISQPMGIRAVKQMKRSATKAVSGISATVMLFIIGSGNSNISDKLSLPLVNSMATLSALVTSKEFRKSLSYARQFNEVDTFAFQTLKREIHTQLHVNPRTNKEVHIFPKTPFVPDQVFQFDRSKTAVPLTPREIPTDEAYFLYEALGKTPEAEHNALLSKYLPLEPVHNLLIC